jgi:superfamily II RNA helicase
VAWQVPLLTLPHVRFLLMSATLGDTSFFEEELTRRNGRPSVTIQSADRPVPLEYSYAQTPLAQTLEQLVAENKCPVYVVHFTQLEAGQSAQDFMSANVCSREEKSAIAAFLEGFKFSSPYGPDIKRWLKHGIGLHHAGLLPKYRVLVEHLAQKGLLKIICGTDTLGVGINVPIRTVLFSKLCKYDGEKTGILSARDFHQIGGRAGRKGFDDRGWVVAQAPEHMVENLKLEGKAARDGKKIVKRKPPEKNFVNWDKQTFARLMAAPPERLSSRFQVSHGMLLNVLSRKGDGCRAMQNLIAQSHESPKAKKALIKRAWQLFRSLVERRIVEFIPPPPQDPAGTSLPRPAKRAAPYLRVNIELQDDFSMDQTLSLYLLETLPLIDPQALDYPLVLLTLVESILEDPDIILRKQLDKLKTQKMAEMKQEGLDYQERMDELEKLEYPKPNREFIYSTFNAFANRHPWVGQENIHPKSIAREMFESFRSFSDYIRDYDLQRAEGLLLRHLSRVHKVLAQTVPDSAKNDTVREMELYLTTLIDQVDSSLLDEWERMRNPLYQARAQQPESRPPGAPDIEQDITSDAKSFTAAIRNRIFSFLRAWANRDFEAALAGLNAPEDSEGEPWTVARLGKIMEEYLVEHSSVCLDPNARNLRYTFVIPAEDKGSWKIQQMLIDPDEHNDWVAEFEVRLAESRAAGAPVLRLRRLGGLV